MKCLLCGRPFIEKENKEISLEGVRGFNEPEVVKEILDRLLFLDKNSSEELRGILGYLKGVCNTISFLTNSESWANKKGEVIPFRRG